MSPLRYFPFVGLCLLVGCSGDQVQLGNTDAADTMTNDSGLTTGGTSDDGPDDGFLDTGCENNVPGGCLGGTTQDWDTDGRGVTGSSGTMDNWGTTLVWDHTSEGSGDSEGGGDSGTSGPDCDAISLGSAMGAEVYDGVLDSADARRASLACNPAKTSDSVGFLWTPPGAGDYTIEVSGDGFDPVLGVSADECGTMSFACSDDCIGTGSGVIVSGWATPIRFTVESADGEGGVFSLSIAAEAVLQCE